MNLLPNNWWEDNMKTKFWTTENNLPYIMLASLGDSIGTN